MTEVHEVAESTMSAMFYTRGESKGKIEGEARSEKGQM